MILIVLIAEMHYKEQILRRNNLRRMEERIKEAQQRWGIPTHWESLLDHDCGCGG